MQDRGAFRAFDGTTWVQGVLPAIPSDVVNLAWGAGVFVAVGRSFALSSSDGKRWGAPVTTDDAGAALAGVGTVVFDGQQFIAYAGKAAYTSRDGAVWTRRPLATPISAAVYGEGLFFAASDAKLWTSGDGFTWTAVHDLGADETTHINGSRVAIGRVLRP